MSLVLLLHDAEADNALFACKPPNTHPDANQGYQVAQRIKGCNEATCMVQRLRMGKSDVHSGLEVSTAT